MHRDEAIYARADARAGGVTVTPEEAQLIAWALNHAAEEWSMNGNESEADKLRALADRLSAALTTPSP